MALLIEGIFRKPRLRTNELLKAFAPLFEGDVVNVSASNDSDKHTSLRDYYFGDYDAGGRYRDYFTAARNYTITNYPGDRTTYRLEDSAIALDLEADLPVELEGRFDVVYNHTSLEHIFDVFKAFGNICRMSRNVVILVVPQFQAIHDYERGYGDYWRFTPFAIDALFERSGFSVVFRETTRGFSESQYLFYVAARRPEQWASHFPPLVPLSLYVNSRNDGSSYTLWSRALLAFDAVVRRVAGVLGIK